MAAAVAAGLEDVYPYFVSALAPGQSLDVALREFGPAVMADALPRLEAIAAGLDLAATSSIWHGNLHPRDVLIHDEDTTVLGLGIAPIVERAGVRVPVRRPYTAPEVGAGGPTSPASDQYSLAALAYEWLYGRRASGPADAPLQLTPLPGVDRDALADAFTTALAPDPRERFESCGAFVAALGRALQDAEPAAAVTPPRDDRAPVATARPPAGTRDPLAEFEAGRTTAADAARIDAVLRGLVDSPSLLDLPERPDEELRLSSDPAADPVGYSEIDDREEAAPLTDRGVPEPPIEPPPPAAEPRHAEVAWQGAFGAESRAGVETRRGGKGRITVVLLVGLLIGAGLGFVLGRTYVPPGMEGGREFTESGIVGPPEATDSPAPAPTSDPGTTARTDQTAAPVSPDQAPRQSADVAPAPEAIEAPVSNAGRLLIRSTPSGAEVSVNGVPRGVTPLAVRDLPLATHTVVFTRPGYARSEQRVALTDARPSRSVEARLVAERATQAPPPATKTPAAAAPARGASRATTGSLLVESRPPAARVTIDGREAGVTPLTLESIAPGVHTVRIERDGYQPWTTTVTIEPGVRARVAASLGGL